MIMSPRNSYVEAHKSDGIWRLCLQVTRAEPHEWDSCSPERYSTEPPVARSFHCRRTQRSGQSATQRAFSRMGPCWCHNLGLPTSKTGWNKCLLFIKPPSLWVFFLVIAAQMDKDIWQRGKEKTTNMNRTSIQYNWEADTFKKSI